RQRGDARRQQIGPAQKRARTRLTLAQAHDRLRLAQLVIQLDRVAGRRPAGRERARGIVEEDGNRDPPPLAHDPVPEPRQGQRLRPAADQHELPAARHAHALERVANLAARPPQPVAEQGLRDVDDERGDERRREHRRERRALGRRECLPHPAAEGLEVGLPDRAHVRERAASSSRSSRWTSCGTAWPPLIFITWPTRKPNVASRPASTCATGPGCSAITARTSGRSASSPLWTATPWRASSSSTVPGSSGSQAKTCFATGPGSVRSPTRARKARNRAPGTREAHSAMLQPRSFRTRSSSVMTQLLASLAPPSGTLAS